MFKIVKYKHVNLFSLIVSNVTLDIKPIEAQLIIEANYHSVKENEHQIIYSIELKKESTNEVRENEFQTVGKTAL